MKQKSTTSGLAQLNLSLFTLNRFENVRFEIFQICYYLRSNEVEDARRQWDRRLGKGSGWHFKPQLCHNWQCEMLTRAASFHVVYNCALSPGTFPWTALFISAVLKILQPSGPECMRQGKETHEYAKTHQMLISLQEKGLRY